MRLPNSFYRYISIQEFFFCLKSFCLLTKYLISELRNFLYSKRVFPNSCYLTLCLPSPNTWDLFSRFVWIVCSKSSFRCFDSRWIHNRKVCSSIPPRSCPNSSRYTARIHVSGRPNIRTMSTGKYFRPPPGIESFGGKFKMWTAEFKFRVTQRTFFLFLFLSSRKKGSFKIGIVNL